MATINKIKVGNTEYDIEASSIGNLSNITVESSENTQTPEILIKSNSTGEKEFGNDADIRFEVASNKSVATGGKVAAVIGLNTKGNLSLESLNKHVNIESVKGIQIKPTTNIIFDTSRRVENQGGSEDGNEAVVETKWDDLEVASGEEYKQMGYLKLHARAIDLRTFWHGGIALQPSGVDGHGNENKIKFESSRKKGANQNIPHSIRITDPDYTEYYSLEGGKGVEFATFNNEHTSIFTRDYRFNDEGKVYSVKRALPVTSNDKTDYPTQADDFKDIPVDSKGGVGTYNNETYSWESASGTYLIAASWNSIVKTANAFNDQPWTDCNISGKGNLQITASDEVEWVEVPEYSGEFESLAEGSEAPKRKYVGDGIVYKLPDNKYYTCQLKLNGEHHINIEADSTIKLESGYNDVEITSKNDKVQLKAPIVQIEGSNIDETTEVDSGVVDFSTTPTISFVSKKISKKGLLEGGSTPQKLIITSLNSFGKTIYDNGTKARIPYDNPLYLSNGTVYTPQLIIPTKPEVFTDSTHQNPAPEGVYVYERGGISIMINVEFDSKKNKYMAKKKATICNLEANSLYTDSGATTAFVLDPESDYTGNEPTLYTASNTQAAEGYYITEVSGTLYVVYVGSENKLQKYNVSNDTETLEWCKPLSYFDTVTQNSYNSIIYGGSNSAQSGEEAIPNESPLKSGSMECDIQDIITLVNYFKDQHQGPWASQ